MRRWLVELVSWRFTFHLGVGNTWDDQGLAAHDEDNFHRAEFGDTEFATESNGKAKFCYEDHTEEADAHGEDNVRGALQPVEGHRTVG